MLIFNKIKQNPMIGNMLIVGVVTFCISILGFFKELLVGSTFGLSEFLDTFALAVLIPSFIQNVFVGAIKNIFIPNYITEIKSTNRLQEFQLLVLGIITLIISLFIILLIILDDQFLRVLYKGHSDHYYSLISSQLYIILPCLYFWGYSGFLSALLETSNKFFYTSIAPIFISITTIISIFFFKNEFGNSILAISILSGSFFSFIYLFAGCYFYKLIKIKKIHFFHLNINMKVMLKQIPAKALSGILTGINPFVDQIFAAQLVAGSVTALNYGNKIPAFGVSIAMVAIGNVLLPHFSKTVNTNIKKAYNELFKILLYIFVLSFSVILIMYFLSYDIINILFERGAFTSSDTEIVSSIQQIFLFRVPFFICTLILVKFLTSINKNNFMALISLLNLITNLILNYIFIDVYGVYGIALSTTCVLIISGFIYFLYTYKKYQLIKNI